MRLDFCAACGTKDKDRLEQHHLWPGEGDESDERETVTLCFSCHGKAHGYERMHVRELTRSALARARAAGVKLGSPSSVQAGQRAAAEARAEVLREVLTRMAGRSLAAIARALNEQRVPAMGGGLWHVTSVRRALIRLRLRRKEKAARKLNGGPSPDQRELF